MNRSLRRCTRTLVAFAMIASASLACAQREAAAPEPINASNAAALRPLVGKMVSVYGPVQSVYVSHGSGTEILNLANNAFAVVCLGESIDHFGELGLAKRYEGRVVVVTGTLQRYKGKLQIQVTEPSQVRLYAPAKPTRPTPSSDDPGDLGLRKVGDEEWLSPAGLRYAGRDPQGLTRLEHVLRHARDLPNREGSHGVFDGGPKGAIAVIDEAWRLAKKRGMAPQVEGDRSAYTVALGRRIGYLGGEAGARRGHPSLQRVFLVVETDTSNLITAFPK